MRGVLDRVLGRASGHRLNAPGAMPDMGIEPDADSPQAPPKKDRFPMTNTQPWHSALPTDRPLYHDDTRCPEGGTIKLKDRRPGDGRRDPCPHCARFLIETMNPTMRDGITGPVGDGPLIVRAKLALGRLRRDVCMTSTVIELGSRRPCDGCDRPISSTEVEMRARFSDGVSLFFHAPCFTAWFTETQRPTRSRSSRDPPPPCEPETALITEVGPKSTGIEAEREGRGRDQPIRAAY